MLRSCPRPPFRQTWKIDNVRRGRLFVFAFAVPFFATLFQGAFQELFAGFVAAIFLAGEFSVDGLSNRAILRTYCELWEIQVATGESPLLQLMLFQARLLRRLPRILRTRPAGAGAGLRVVE